MRLREFYLYLEKSSELTKSEIESRVGRIRHEGMIEKSGRGFNAREITAQDAAKVLLAISGARKAEEAVEKVKELSATQCVDNDARSLRPADNPFMGCDTLLDLFEYLIETEGASAAIGRILIFPSTASATVYAANGQEYRYRVMKKKGNGFVVPEGRKTSKTFRLAWEIQGLHFSTIHEALFPMSGELTPE